MPPKKTRPEQLIETGPIANSLTLTRRNSPAVAAPHCDFHPLYSAHHAGGTGPAGAEEEPSRCGDQACGDQDDDDIDGTHELLASLQRAPPASVPTTPHQVGAERPTRQSRPAPDRRTPAGARCR